MLLKAGGISITIPLDTLMRHSDDVLNISLTEKDGGVMEEITVRVNKDSKVSAIATFVNLMAKSGYEYTIRVTGTFIFVEFTYFTPNEVAPASTEFEGLFEEPTQ